MTLDELINATKEAVHALENEPGKLHLQHTCRHSRDAWDLIFTLVSLTGEIPVEATHKLIELIDRAVVAAEGIDPETQGNQAGEDVPIHETLRNIESRKPELLELVGQDVEIESVEELSVFH